MYGDGTRVQRGISGSWQAATIAGTSASRRPRTTTTPSVSVGACRDGIAAKRATMLAAMQRLARLVFWGAAAKLAWTQVGYGLFLAALRRARGNPPVAPAGDAGTPAVSLIVAAYREEAVIAAKVADALALDWPRDRLEIVVAVDGGADPGADATAERARAAGADVVLELPRGGKVRAQDAAVAASSGELLAFSDANSSWEPGALRALLAPFADPAVAYVCGQVRFLNDGGHEPGGRLLALRDVAAGERVRARLGDRRATGRSTRSAAPPTCTSTRSWATTSRSRSTSSSAAAARSTRRTRARSRRWCRRSRARAPASGG